MLRRRNQEEEADNFYISWSDLVTLLLVFFVYLYSISEIDIVKFLEAKGSMSQEVKFDSERQMLDALKLEQQKLEQMMVDIDQFIEEEKLQDVFSVKYLDDRLELNFGNVLLFSTGHAKLKTRAKGILRKVAEMVKHTESQIVIEGHTDNIPIKRSKFYPSNWELSSARAASVVRTLVSYGVKEGRFIVIGYNAYRPLVPNTSAMNRSKNRRVKITLKPDKDKILEKIRKTNT